MDIFHLKLCHQRGAPAYHHQDELQKFGFEEVKTATEYYCLHNIITAEEKLLAIKYWSLFRERISKLCKSPSVERFTDILC